MQYTIPDLLGRFGKPEQFAIFLIYHAFVDQEIQIDRLAPVALAHQDDGDRLDLACLYERQHLEQFVEGAIPPRKSDKRLCSHEKMELAHGKIMKVEAKVGRDVGVGILLMWQADVETDRFGADVECATIGGLHDSRSAAGHDDPLLSIGRMVRRAHKATEFSSNFIILALGEDTSGNCQAARQVLVAGVGRQRCLQHIHLTLCSSWFAYSRTSEDHDRMANAVLFKQQLGLEIVDLQADAPHAVPRQEIEVGVGPA